MNTIVNSTLIMAAVAIIVYAITLATSAYAGPAPEEADEIRGLVDTGQATLIDVRTPREFAANGLDAAINIPVQELPQRYDELDDLDQPVVLYCRSGNRSAHAKTLLENEFGSEEIYDLGSRRSAQRVFNPSD